MRTSRTIKLTIALVVALTACTFAAIAASARPVRPAHHAAGACRISLGFLSKIITAHESATAIGTLRCGAGHTTLAGEHLTLYERAAGSPAFAVAAEGSAEADGAYALVAGDIASNASFYVAGAGAVSATRTVRVIGEVTVKGPPEGVVFTRSAHRPAARFEGQVSPVAKGALVILQRQNALNGNGWFSIGYSRVSETGTFTIVHNFVVPGPANVRVLVRDPQVMVASPSNVLGYEISQTENPLLRIESSADPISYGQPVTITGSVAGVPAGTPVKLVSHSPSHPFFTVVHEGTTGSGGSYSFPALTPPVGTYYKVLCAGKSSAVLFEGVKYVLTASVSGASSTELGSHLGFAAAQGQSLVFSGTVQPGIDHHWVYLEREDANHAAFHVVETSEVHPPEPPAHPEYWYSISYTPAAPGTSTLRIKIPGDPQNGGTESETFTLQVSPAPASTLKPAAPARLPSEGQT